MCRQHRKYRGFTPWEIWPLVFLNFLHVSTAVQMPRSRVMYFSAHGTGSVWATPMMISVHSPTCSILIISPELPPSAPDLCKGCWEWICSFKVPRCWINSLQGLWSILPVHTPATTLGSRMTFSITSQSGPTQRVPFCFDASLDLKAASTQPVGWSPQPLGPQTLGWKSKIQ